MPKITIKESNGRLRAALAEADGFSAGVRTAIGAYSYDSLETTMNKLKDVIKESKRMQSEADSRRGSVDARILQLSEELARVWHLVRAYANDPLLGKDSPEHARFETVEKKTADGSDTFRSPLCQRR